MKKIESIITPILILLFSACEDYQTESYTMSAIDNTACTISYVDSLTVNKTAKSLSDTSFTSMQDSISFLMVNDDQVISVSSNSFYISVESDTSYLVFTASGATLIIFDNSVSLIMKNTAGHFINPSSETIELSTVAECPEIKTRNEFDLTSGNYLIGIITENLNNTLCAVMNNE